MNSSNLQNRNLYADVTVSAVSMPRIFVTSRRWTRTITDISGIGTGVLDINIQDHIECIYWYTTGAEALSTWRGYWREYR